MGTPKPSVVETKDFFQNAILLITKSLVPIPVPGQYRLSRCLGGVLARALPEGLRYLWT
jgi:hypothetical protein